MKITVVVLAGGKSERMGTDKALMEIGGTTLLERLAQVCNRAGLPMAVVGRSCPNGWQLSDVPFLPDNSPGFGPIGGLITALQHFDGGLAMIACDMPKLSCDALTWLADQADAVFERDGLIILNGGEIEPLFSVYFANSLPLAQQSQKSGILSIKRLIKSGSFAYVEAPDWLCGQLVNVNTRQDWETMKEELP